jgi:hypothetical protein
MSQMINNICHILNHERDMAADVATDVTADMNVDMAVDMADDVHADTPCFHGPVSSDPNIFSLLI